jgi:flagellar biosynthesis protein FlhA
MLMGLLGMMILPVPAFLLDVFFTFNITLSIVILLVCVYALRPMDFAAFPTVLLLATLLRLALNVASTRIVLLEGHNGGDAAGKVIESFGAVLIGGNYAVGLVVFAILMIINFLVVTKGADLNAGLINQEDAKFRRREVAEEADFYGSMDGASKFVKGDAVAGLLILAINIIGGIAIGMAQHGLDFSLAVERYALLTIGDGLVAQIPSLLLSTAAAIMVTRTTSSQDMGSQILQQMFDVPKALPAPAENRELGWDDVATVDIVGLEVGYRLIPVMDGITAVREILRKHPIPVLMFSSLTYDGARVTLDALEAGAVWWLTTK